MEMAADSRGTVAMSFSEKDGDGTIITFVDYFPFSSDNRFHCLFLGFRKVTKYFLKAQTVNVKYWIKMSLFIQLTDIFISVDKYN